MSQDRTQAQARRRSVGLLALTMLGLAFVASACSSLPDLTKQGPAPDATSEVATTSPLAELELADGMVISSVARIGDFSIVTIDDPSAANDTEYLTLPEAMAAGWVAINEVGGGTVNTLLVSNFTNKPIFILNGDLLLGGKQDRIAAESMLIDAATERVAIPVFCVEHGRWTDRKEFEGASQFTQGTSFRYNVASTVRRAAMQNSQARVWQEVATVNSNFAVSGETATGSYRASLSNETIAKRSAEIIETIKRDLCLDGAEGIAFIYKGEILTSDVLGSSGLFSKLAPTLMQSYAHSLLNEQIEVEADASRQGIMAKQASERLEAFMSLDGIIDRVAPRAFFSQAAIEWDEPTSKFFGNQVHSNRVRNSNIYQSGEGSIRFISTSLGVGPPIEPEMIRIWTNAMDPEASNTNTNTRAERDAVASERRSRPTANTENVFHSDQRGVSSETKDKVSGKKIHKSINRRR